MQQSKQANRSVTEIPETIVLIYSDGRVSSSQHDRRLVSTFNGLLNSEFTIGNISQIVWRRWRDGSPSQVGHARSAPRVSLRWLCARPAHKHALTHELLSSRRDSERPSARFNFSTNLLWNFSSRAPPGGLPEPLLGLSGAARSETREWGARQYDNERIAGALRWGLSPADRGDNAGPSDRDSDIFRTLPPTLNPAFSADSEARRDLWELYMSQSFFTTGIMNAISAKVAVTLLLERF